MALRKRESVELKPSRWAAYSAAGLATALFMPEAAQADIFHTIYNQHVEDTDPTGFTAMSYTAPLATGPAGAVSLRLRHVANSIHVGIAWASLVATGTANGGFAGMTATNGYRYPANLPYGQAIQNLTQFTIGGAQGSLAYDLGYPNTQFGSPGTGFVAFRFDVGNGTQYGWARLNMDGNAATYANAFDLVDLAFADAGESLFVGQIAAVDEPSSLGVLATGAVGLLAWRRRRRKPIQ